MLQDLITEANEHVVRVNKLCKELEGFEGILQVVDLDDSKVALFGPAGTGTTFIDLVLSLEKMAELKQMVVMSLAEAQIAKEKELQKLMGIRNPAMPNPVFEAATHGMIKKSEGPEQAPVPTVIVNPELTVEAVRKLYVDEGKTLTEVAAYFGVKKTMLNSFINRNKLNRVCFGKDDGFRDAEVEKHRKERP